MQLAVLLGVCCFVLRLKTNHGIGQNGIQRGRPHLPGSSQHGRKQLIIKSPMSVTSAAKQATGPRTAVATSDGVQGNRRGTWPLPKQRALKQWVALCWLCHIAFWYMAGGQQ